LGIQRFVTADIGRIFRGQTVSGLSEWQLLERYLERRDEVAFEALVARHGPMVLGVCRRMLDSQPDVEDAFQATFLVLVRRARQLGPQDAIGPWLHGVAARVAQRARCEAARRRRFESIQIDAAASPPTDTPADAELAELLDQELRRLPPKYRSPIVLCYLEGQTHEEAARELKWPVGTVKGRLARARGLLRDRLARRGLAPAMLAIEKTFGKEASAAVQRELLESTVRASLISAMGYATTQVVSTSVATLAEGALRAMLFNKIQWIAAAFLISALALAGAGVMAQQHGKPLERKLTQSTLSLSEGAGTGLGRNTAKAPSDSAPSAPSSVGSPAAAKSAPSNTQFAMAGLAAANPPTDPASELLQAANHAWNKVYAEFADGSGTVDRLHEASALLMEAQKQGSTAPAETAAAIRDHLDRIRAIGRLRQNVPNAAATIEGDNAKLLAFAAKAELELALGANATGQGGGGFGQGGGGFGGDASKPKKGHFASGVLGHGKDPKSLLIVHKLDDMVPMKFPDETTLEDLIKHIQEATKTSEMAHAIPIYIDPLGLQEAERSLTSTVRINLEGVPLKRTLQLALKQLGLAYFVDDGMIYITSQDSLDQMSHLEPAIPEQSPLTEEGERGIRGELTVEEMKQWLEKHKVCAAVRAALETDTSGGPGLDESAAGAVAGRGGAAPGLDQEIKKLTATNDELKKKLDIVESQLAEIRTMMMQLAKPEKPAADAKKKGGLQ
jgi:RNA polymerase sigma factor (sigma-70 family)